MNCNLCGEMIESTRFGLVEVLIISEKSVQSYFMDERNQFCKSCRKTQVQAKTSSVALPPYLIVKGQL